MRPRRSLRRDSCAPPGRNSNLRPDSWPDLSCAKAVGLSKLNDGAAGNPPLVACAELARDERRAADHRRRPLPAGSSRRRGGGRARTMSFGRGAGRVRAACPGVRAQMMAARLATAAAGGAAGRAGSNRRMRAGARRRDGRILRVARIQVLILTMPVEPAGARSSRSRATCRGGNRSFADEDPDGFKISFGQSPSSRGR